MRGKVHCSTRVSIHHGITPAYAGKSSPIQCYIRNRGDHPRVCGEKTGILRVNSYNAGSPPRMRGKVPSSGSSKWYWGITPAYAGKRECPTEGAPAAGDHPRVCGEKSQFVVIAPRYMGSPPRMRGKVFPPYSPAWKYRITPAYAGKSSLPFPPRKCCRDHPRVCGEKRARKTSTARWQGSPPRMRGKVEIQLPTGHSRGITPAYAGKSWTRQTKQFVSWDHPRVCGEKLFH